MHKHMGVLCALFFIFIVSATPASAETRSILFPVAGVAHFKDDFADPRGGGTRQHLGNDIMADKMTPILAPVDGVVSYLVSPEASWGYSLTLTDSDGYRYKFLHINNDTPGTDDGMGGEEHAYAAGITRGTTVARGQLIGWVGDSGNAEDVGSHLHFEIWSPDRSVINPYDTLVAAAASSSGITVTDMGEAPRIESITVIHEDSVQHHFSKLLKKGMKGEEVRQLQIRLRALGYLAHTTPTGNYGPLTVAAVKALQKKHGLEQTGATGPKTRALLNS